MLTTEWFEVILRWNYPPIFSHFFLTTLIDSHAVNKIYSWMSRVADVIILWKYMDKYIIWQHCLVYWANNCFVHCMGEHAVVCFIVVNKEFPVMAVKQLLLFKCLNLNISFYYRSNMLLYSILFPISSYILIYLHLLFLYWNKTIRQYFFWINLRN